MAAFGPVASWHFPFYTCRESSSSTDQSEKMECTNTSHDQMLAMWSQVNSCMAIIWRPQLTLLDQQRRPTHSQSAKKNTDQQDDPYPLRHRWLGQRLDIGVVLYHVRHVYVRQHWTKMMYQIDGMKEQLVIDCIHRLRCRTHSRSLVDCPVFCFLYPAHVWRWMRQFAIDGRFPCQLVDKHARVYFVFGSHGLLAVDDVVYSWQCSSNQKQSSETIGLTFRRLGKNVHRMMSKRTRKVAGFSCSTEIVLGIGNFDQTNIQIVRKYRLS